MQWVINSLLVLAMCEPLFLDAKKVVIVMPRYQRRVQSTPWSQLRRIKKNGFSNHVFPGQNYGFSHGPQIYRPKEIPIGKDQYPSGGDDFDQGHEEVNHVMIPHGKGISHAVSFGKGYIPFETLKDHRSSVSHHHDFDEEHSSGHGSGYSSSGSFPSSPSYAQAYLSKHADSYVRNDDNNEQDGSQDRSQERSAQNFASSKSLFDTTNTPNAERHFSIQGLSSKPSGGIYLPSGIPSPTIGGSKQGIVLRDSIAFGDYNKKIEEFTKNWPASFGNANSLVSGSMGSNRHGTLQLHDMSQQFDGFPGGTNFPLSLSQQQQGYKVKEDIIDTPHDFRTMPIQTAPPGVQTPQPQIQYIHQPVQQSLQHIISQPPQIPLSYGVHSNFQGFLHG